MLVEAAYLVGKLVGASAESGFVRELARSSFTFEPFAAEDLERMAELMDTYLDLPLGTVDAAVIATAERLGVSTIATLDHRHFTVVRPRHVDSFELVP